MCNRVRKFAKRTASTALVDWKHRSRDFHFPYFPGTFHPALNKRELPTERAEKSAK